ncbi:hypothetical protein K488DRAFT_50024 [Vararia minispora EC-137]|uniref:Uncharacterized protein n=1 Tax=Vararia minispora EC-137 TaxID=1314806 RepID=A0ACB8QKZ1_9AGAM|nr:hypothetical protein K488DRAFT_50024 [Vararia minispora EC-137]
MTAFNPLVQGWAWSRTSTSTSMLGALPVVSMPPAIPAPSLRPMLPLDSLSFHITHYRPNILNATILGPQNRRLYRSVTDGTPGCPTVLRDEHQRAVALVDWSGPPTVEIPGVLKRTPARNWLHLSANRTSRHMEVRGMKYLWQPVGADICLFLNESDDKSILARVSRDSSGATLEMSGTAMQHGLLEICLVASTLFLSGANLD